VLQTHFSNDYLNIIIIIINNTFFNGGVLGWDFVSLANGKHGFEKIILFFSLIIYTHLKDY